MKQWYLLSHDTVHVIHWYFNLAAVLLGIGDDPPHNGDQIQDDHLHLLVTFNGSLLKNYNM